MKRVKTKHTQKNWAKFFLQSTTSLNILTILTQSTVMLCISYQIYTIQSVAIVYYLAVLTISIKPYNFYQLSKSRSIIKKYLSITYDLHKIAFNFHTQNIFQFLPNSLTIIAISALLGN